jgi:hypothetical protein
MVEILRAHVCKWKNKMKLFQEWGEGDKGE